MKQFLLILLVCFICYVIPWSISMILPIILKNSLGHVLMFWGGMGYMLFLISYNIDK